MKRWHKVLIFLVGMSFFMAMGWGVGIAVTAWYPVYTTVCEANCSSAPDFIFWIQMIGLGLMSVSGIMWIVLPDHDIG